MLKLFKYLQKRDWSMIAAALVFIVAQVWLDLKMPDYRVPLPHWYRHLVRK